MSGFNFTILRRFVSAGALAALLVRSALGAGATMASAALATTPAIGVHDTHVASIVTLEGPIHLLGLEETVRMVFDDTGRFLWHADGKIRLRGGFDGTKVWSDDFGTPPRVLHFTEREELITLGAVLSGRWNREDGPLEITKRENDTATFAFRGGTTRGTIKADADGRAVSATWGEGPGRETVRLAEWRKVGGQWIPGKVERESTGAGLVSMELKPSKGVTDAAIFDMPRACPRSLTRACRTGWK